MTDDSLNADTASEAQSAEVMKVEGITNITDDESIPTKAMSSEDDLSKIPVADKEEIPEKEKKEKVEKHEFSKERQREQFTLANQRKRIANLEQQLAQTQDNRPKKVSALEKEISEEEDALKLLEKNQEVLKQQQTWINQQQESIETIQVEKLNSEMEVAYKDHIENMCQVYGPENKNEALTVALKAAQEMGYMTKDNANPPGFDLTCTLIENGFLRAGKIAPPSTAGEPIRTKTVKVDDGRRGNVAPRNDENFQGTHEAVLADMRRKAARQTSNDLPDNLI